MAGLVKKMRKTKAHEKISNSLGYNRWTKGSIFKTGRKHIKEDSDKKKIYDKQEKLGRK